MNLPFFKMHAQGNDYIYFDFTDEPVPDLPFDTLAAALSERRFGVGADGIVLILPPNDAKHDVRMRIFNADGSEAEICGSALRCITGWLGTRLEKDEIVIETIAGVKKGVVIEKTPQLITSISMGKPRLVAEHKVQGYVGLEIDMGNPHFVIFDEQGPLKEIIRIGPMIERDEQFTHGVNVHLAIVENPTSVHIGIWERGSGPTLACGSGACATAYAGIRLGKLAGETIEVHQPGGMVQVSFDEETQEITLSGEVSFVFTGTVDV